MTIQSCCFVVHRLISITNQLKPSDWTRAGHRYQYHRIRPRALPKTEVFGLAYSPCFHEGVLRVYLKKIVCNKKHSVLNCIVLNLARASSHLNTVYCPPQCRTQKRLNRFFSIKCQVLTEDDYFYFIFLQWSNFITCWYTDCNNKNLNRKEIG